MLIRSQDKNKIVNVDNCILITTILSCNTKYNITVDGMGIGTYSTEEKATKVLDMIQAAYNTAETMKIDKCAWRDNHYFQMPQDSEVTP